MALVAVSGIGIAVFHPADYAILAAQVDGERQGRAFGIHIFSGYAGWVVAPPIMLGLVLVLDWSEAVSVAGLVGLLFVAFAALFRDALGDDAIRVAPGGTGSAIAARPSVIRLLASPPVLMFLLFFTALATGTSGIHAFAVVALVELYGASLAAANAQLTGYFMAAAIGVLIGGVIADRVRDQEGLAALCFVVSAAFLGVIALKLLPIAYVIIPMLGSAFTIGLMSPVARPHGAQDLPAGNHRDRVRLRSPPGFSVGAAVGPPIFGYVADIGRPDLIFWLSGAFTLVCIVSIYAAKAVAR